MTYIQNGERWATTRGKINQVIKVRYAELLADTELTYTANVSGSVEAGYIYPTSDAMNWEVAASDASDHHATTAGGVKLYEAGPNFSTRARAVAWWARMVAASNSVAFGAEITDDQGRYVYDGTTATVSGLNGWSPNMAVAGTVDGRDVATDGTKLDGIESGATGDMTGAEIKAA
ncbi:MAG: hypothetical protein EBT13_06615, partial [Rhodobacteraceae bacterium]|nr:hypothetical protein [Paracoccaceae bacterium]